MGGIQPFSLATDRTVYRPGSRVQVTARFRDASELDPGIQLLHGEVEQGGKDTTAISLQPSGSAGEFITSFDVSKPGPHVIRVWTGDASARDIVKAGTLRFDVEVPNLFGSAQRVGFRTLLGTERRIFRFTYHTPYFARYKLDTNFFVERVFEEQFDTIEIAEDSWRLTAQQNRRLRRSLNLQWSYSFKRIVTAFDDAFFGPISFSQKQSLFTTALVGD